MNTCEFQVFYLFIFPVVFQNISTFLLRYNIKINYLCIIMIIYFSPTSESLYSTF